MDRLFLVMVLGDLRVGVHRRDRRRTSKGEAEGWRWRQEGRRGAGLFIIQDNLISVANLINNVRS